MTAPDTVSQKTELFFVSDTQQPMLVEQILLRPNQNLKATAGIFASFLDKKAQYLFMLGDVVSLGYVNRKWRKVDHFLETCRKNGTAVYGIMGNHDVMGRPKKGEANFQKRFPAHIRTGYVVVVDSIGVIMLNSNFATLTPEEKNEQQQWYKTTLAHLDTSDEIKAVIVCCHHAPFSNSRMVGCSKQVQENFIPAYTQSKKASLFITGHSHAYEHFKIKGKDFLVIGGGGGLNQPLRNSNPDLADLAIGYKPNFHYLTISRIENHLIVTSHFLNTDFKGFDTGRSFDTSFAT